MKKYNLDESYRVKNKLTAEKETIFTELNVLCEFKKHMIESNEISEVLATKWVDLFQHISEYAFKTHKSKKKLTEIRDKSEFKKIANFLIVDKYIKNSFKSYDRNAIRDCFCNYYTFIEDSLTKDYSADVTNEVEILSIKNSEDIEKVDNDKNGKLIFDSSYKEKIYRFTKMNKYTIDDETKQKLLSVMSEYFKRGFKLNSIIDTKKFCDFYNEKYGIELQVEGGILGKILSGICVQYESERIMAPDNVADKVTFNVISEYILTSFKEGKQAIYYEGIYNQFKDRLLNTNVYNSKILKNLLAFYLSNKYNFQRSYMAVSESVTIDTSAEVEALLKSNGFPMPFDDIAEELSHIPRTKLQQALKNGINFVEAEDKRYNHISMYDITENELNIIKNYIKELFENIQFITIRKLFSVLSERRAEFLELNVITNATCLKDVLYYYLRKDFEFKWSFIGKIGVEMSVPKMIRNFTDGRDTFTLTDLAALGNDLDINITQGGYIKGILENYIRLDIDNFAKPNLLHFDIQATDEVISKFCIDGYTSLSSIDRFSIFPSVSIPWNGYLLESYVNHYSKQFEIMNYSRSVKKNIGAVVDKAAGFTKYDEVLADLAYKNNNLDLKNEESVIEFFYNNGYVTKRTIKTYIGNILSIAEIKKQSKGM